MWVGVSRRGGRRSRQTGGSTGLKAGNRLRRAWREAKEEMKSRGKQSKEREEEEEERGERGGGGVSRVNPSLFPFFGLILAY